MNEAANQFQVGQRVRYKRGRRGSTGRVTGTWQHPGGEFYEAQPGVEVTMDHQYSPPPVPVRYHTLASDFELLPEDYLGDAEALDELARTVTHIPGDWAQAAGMLNAVLSILRRNERITENPE